MAATGQIALNHTKHSSEDDVTAQSDKVALTMGAFSMVLLLLTFFVLYILHYFLA